MLPQAVLRNLISFFIGNKKNKNLLFIFKSCRTNVENNHQNFDQFLINRLSIVEND